MYIYSLKIYMIHKDMVTNVYINNSNLSISGLGL